MVSSSPAETLSPQKATGVVPDIVIASGGTRIGGRGFQEGSGGEGCRARRENGSLEGEREGERGREVKRNGQAGAIFNWQAFCSPRFHALTACGASGLAGRNLSDQPHLARLNAATRQPQPPHSIESDQQLVKYISVCTF